MSHGTVRNAQPAVRVLECYGKKEKSPEKGGDSFQTEPSPRGMGRRRRATIEDDMDSSDESAQENYDRQEELTEMSVGKESFLKTHTSNENRGE